MKVIKERVFTLTDLMMFTALTLVSGAAIIIFLAHWFSYEDWITHPLSFSILTFILLFRIANSQARWMTLPFMKRPQVMKPAPALKVAVVTTIVPGSESLEMLEVTLRALVALNYAHDTWVLDEGDDERVKELSRKMGARHFTRRNLPQYLSGEGTYKARFKHGNYNAWLSEVGFDRYDIITAFDPDHIPTPTFLTEVLGYFKDPSIGFVQVAQAYYNQEASFIARGAAEETYEFYSCTQMASYGLGEPQVIGCHYTHRVTALREVGGFAPHAADDLLIGMRYRAHGWHGVYLPRILARGLTPVDWNGYLTQQMRWTRSLLDVKFRLQDLTDKKPSLIARTISALHGLFYMQNSITSFIGIFLLSYMLVSGDVPFVVGRETLPKFLLMVVALLTCLIYRQRFYLDPDREWGLHWRSQLLRYAKWPVYIRAFWGVLFSGRDQYDLTHKLRADSHSNLLLLPQTLIILLMSAAWVTGILLGSIVPTLIYWIAAAVIITSFFLILSDRLDFPEPFEKRLICQSSETSAS
ncbi:MAG: glycosyltransferase [Acidobacteria bacterium]|nr:glycosyltransferase [Acidobacteriota bacterium]